MTSAMNPPVRPFLPYNNPSISSVEDLNAFDPKRISRQATEPPVPRLQLMAPYVQLDESMTAKIERAHRHNAAPISKRGLLVLKTLAISLRVVQLACAMALVVGMLFVRKLDDTTAWICRVPPAVAVFHIVYFVYHVSGSDRVRTPRSSVNYFLFALTVDLAIVSFYSFIGVLAWEQYQGSPDNVWTTIFNDPETALKIFLSVFLIVCGSVVLTILSIFNTLYLVRVFRRLANLPVDQNPFLDDNYIPLPSKRWSQSTAASSAPSLPEVSKAVPFLQTRRSDAPSFRDSVLYTNVPVPPLHTPRHSQLYPATGHLYPASGPVSHNRPEDRAKGVGTTITTKEIITETDSTTQAPSIAPRSKRVKKSWGNLKAPTTTKRKESSGEGEVAVETRTTSSSLQPEEGGREWSFSFRRRSGASAGAP